MMYRLVLSYWNEKDELCGCDVVQPVPMLTPEQISEFPILAPAQTVHLVASLESLVDTSLLWIAGYEMSENGEN